MGDPHAKIREYIDHRLMRERQVIQCLRDGHYLIDSMVRTIYQDIPPVLISVARLSVEAHLVKLVREKRVHRDGDAFSLADT
jgi:hypothetical protein